MVLAFNLTELTNALVHLTGFGLVLVTLTLLWGLTLLMSRLVRLAGPKASPAATPASSATMREEPAPKAAPPPVEGPAPEIIAALSATVTMMLGDRHRIISVRPASRSYGLEGRRSHFGSHKIR